MRPWVGYKVKAVCWDKQLFVMPPNDIQAFLWWWPTKCESKGRNSYRSVALFVLVCVLSASTCAWGRYSCLTRGLHTTSRQQNNMCVCVYVCGPYGERERERGTCWHTHTDRSGETHTQTQTHKVYNVFHKWTCHQSQQHDAQHFLCVCVCLHTEVCCTNKYRLAEWWIKVRYGAFTVRVGQVVVDFPWYFAAFLPSWCLII